MEGRRPDVPRSCTASLVFSFSLRWPMEKQTLFQFISPFLCLTCHKSKLNSDLLVRNPPILFENPEDSEWLSV